MAKQFKTTSGKQGNLMEVITDKDYGKDTRGEAKSKIFMPIDHSNKEKSNYVPLVLDNDKELQQEIDDYNNSIEVIEDLYNELQVTSEQRVLVRLYKYDHIVNGLVRPHLYELPLKSGAPGKSNETQQNPFPFKSHGVVISSSVDKHKRGDKVIVQPQSVKPYFDRDFHLYSPPIFAFKHPEDKRDYSKTGYILLSANDVLATYKQYD